MSPRVVAVTSIEGQALLLQFNNGEHRHLDVRPYRAHGVFERLREPAFFALMQSEHASVGWPGGIDLVPDSLHLDSVAVKQAAPT